MTKRLIVAAVLALSGCAGNGVESMGKCELFLVEGACKMACGDKVIIAIDKCDTSAFESITPAESTVEEAPTVVP